MKKFFLLFIWLYSFGLEVVIDTTNEYSILTMTNDKDFMCKKKDEKSYICKFDTIPSTPVFDTSSVYFKIEPFFVKDKFYIKFNVKNKSFIKSFSKNLYEGYNKRLTNLQKAKKWVIISYKNKLPFLTNKPIKGLKFPLEVDIDISLKAVDENSNPIDYDTQTQNVVDYFSILRKYNKNVLSIDDCDEYLRQYPDSIFVPDVLFLKLKLLDKENKSEEIINIANKWVNQYASNEHLPEVLLMLAKSYANEGQMEDASYMYERLFIEYDDTKYAYEGMVYLADQLYSAGDNKRAFQLYQKAFTKTKDIEVASLAASRIAQRYLDEGNIKESTKYYTKLFNSNKKYLLKDTNDAYKLANQLASNKVYPLAIKIAQELIKRFSVNDDLYEELLFKLALWSYNDKDYQQSQKYIDEYLNQFPYGDYIENINDLKNKILFEIDDSNTTYMIQRYDEIMQKYKNSDLASKAFQKKVNLLYKLKKYRDILNLSKSHKDINKTILKDSVYDIVKKDLKTLKCDEALKLYKEYNVSLDKTFDDNLYKCAFDTRNFEIASVVCNKYLISSDNQTLLKWLKNKEKVFEITNNYQKLVLIIDDICRLTKNCYDYKYKQFFAYYNLNKPNEFLKIASQLMKKDNIKNIDIFMKVLSYAKREDNNLMIYTYSKKILQLQQKYKTYIQSPYVDFTFVKVAKKLNKQKEAIKVLKHLVNLNISDEDKARAYYTLASLTSNKKYLTKCIKLKKSKIWKPLCKDSLELYQ